MSAWQSTLKHHQCSQPLVDAEFGTGNVSHSKDVKYYLQPAQKAFFFQILAFKPTNLSKYHTDLKIGQLVGPVIAMSQGIGDIVGPGWMSLSFQMWDGQAWPDAGRVLRGEAGAAHGDGAPAGSCFSLS